MTHLAYFYLSLYLFFLFELKVDKVIGIRVAENVDWCV